MLKNFLQNLRASTAIEFALLAGPFLLVVLATVELGVKSFTQAEVDRVLGEVTTYLSITASDSEDAKDFIDSTLCGIAGPLLDCSRIDVGSVVVSGRLFDYRNRSLSGEWDLGCGGDVILVELTYPYTDLLFPFAIADIVTVADGQRYRSRSVLRREPLLAGAGACVS